MTKDRSPLLPVRHPDGDLFVCDVLDAAPKGDMASMEHPIFSLSTKPDRRSRRYENRNQFIEIQPSHLGLATIHDRDVLIYCISHLVAALNGGKTISQTVKLKAYDLLRATNRQTSGRGYDLLKECFQRLRGTQISTNIITGDTETFDVFGLIEHARIVRETRDGRMQDVEIKLSDWVFNAIQAKEVLSIHRDYFRLRKPLERRIYELARKHCGRQPEWRISLENLQRKCGSNSTLREFRRLVGTICEQDEAHSHMPDYAVRLDDDVLVVTGRGTLPKVFEKPGAAAGLDPISTFQPDEDTLEAARECAPGWDVYALLTDWKQWASEREEKPRNLTAAFLGFCRKRGSYPK